MRIIISGGGSGGHVYPAIAIADALKAKGFEDILFVGAEGKMEMKKVPEAGYPIEGLWISGFHRKQLLRNLMFPVKLIASLLKAKKIIEKFEPDIVIGVGGFASGPLLKVAQFKSIPTVIQEQNSYPGITNKLLSKGAHKIFVAYPGMERFFESSRIIMTGNPVRKDIINLDKLTEDAFSYFDLDPDKKTILIFGGSLGAYSINNAIKDKLEVMDQEADVQLLWQVGSHYFNDYKDLIASGRFPRVIIKPFIDRMDLAYAVADLVICRAGALTISELSLAGKPAILVPSPNVAEDHQTRNAEALVKHEAATLIKDSEAQEKLVHRAIELLKDKPARESLGNNIKRLGRPAAGDLIAEEIIKLISDDA